MKIYSDIRLRQFEFWGPAKERAEQLSYNEMNEVEDHIEELYPDGISDGELNDMFAYDFDSVVRWLGYDDEEDYDLQHDPFYVSDEELEECCEWWLKSFLWELDEDDDDDRELIMTLLTALCLDDKYDEFLESNGNNADISLKKLISEWCEEEGVDIWYEVFYGDTGYNMDDRIDSTDSFRMKAMDAYRKEAEKKTSNNK